MSKYNANGGQRRSAKAKFQIPYVGPMIKCRLCDSQEDRMSAKLKDWEMQHFHLSDGDLQFMTCPQCKVKSPLEMMEVVGVDL